MATRAQSQPCPRSAGAPGTARPVTRCPARSNQPSFRMSRVLMFAGPATLVAVGRLLPGAIRAHYRLEFITAVDHQVGGRGSDVSAVRMPTKHARVRARSWEPPAAP